MTLVYAQKGNEADKTGSLRISPFSKDDGTRTENQTQNPSVDGKTPSSREAKKRTKVTDVVYI